MVAVAGRCGQPGSARQHSAARRRFLLLAAALLGTAQAIPAGAASPGDRARISGLSDLGFGTVASFASDVTRTESICIYSKSPPANYYRVTASGSGTGGAFLLSSGADTLAYDVQWSDTPDQAIGTTLTANQPLTAQQTSAGASSADDCSKGPATTASLIVILRASALAASISGNYTGTLTLLVAPE